MEFYPEEGKYHYSGHRKCGVIVGPEETRRSSGRCPNCGRPLTLGVKHRVSALSDVGNDGPNLTGEAGPAPRVETRPPFFKLLALQKIMAQSMGVGMGSKKLLVEYHRIVSQVGGELRLLTRATLEELSIAAGEALARLVIRARNGQVVVAPGYDGVYGQVRVMTDDEEDKGFLDKDF